MSHSYGDEPSSPSPHNSPTQPMLPPGAMHTGSGDSGGSSSSNSNGNFYHAQFPTYNSTNTPAGSMGPKRGSMVLYRFASPSPAASPRHSCALDDGNPALIPPRFPRNSAAMSGYTHSRDSTFSFGPNGRPSSIVSTGSDSKYPMLEKGLNGGGILIPYEYDPDEDDDEDINDPFDDYLHDVANAFPTKSSKAPRPPTQEGYQLPWRGLANVGVLVLVICALLLLFILYPVITFIRNNARLLAIDGNIRVNSTGQVPILSNFPQLIDPDTPAAAKSRRGFDGQDYDLVFSDEFNVDGRTFYPGDDPYWEAVDLWYGATGDIEWYDPSQVRTMDGNLVITMDSADTKQANLTRGSTAPFTTDQNHQLTYRSGMLQSWNKLCFSGGYIEVSLILPGPNADTQGYWPGVWTMGNLGRPGYGATTDGMWPYTYDSCDVGTFPNQTWPNHSYPEAAVNSQYSRSKYNMELSWLTGQRLSACSCPGSDHPGPSGNNGRAFRGRGAPEIDVLEAEKDKETNSGQVVSQSAQFAPFTHDYVFGNTSTDQWTIYDNSKTRVNSYHGSAVQQAVSALSKVPSEGFQGVSSAQGQRYVTYGFEYNPSTSGTQDGFITWQVDGVAMARMGAGAVGPDPIVPAANDIYPGANGGSGVDQRLIPEEPMGIILNLGISPNWQTIDLSSMIFPAELLIDYVRVYQRRGTDPKVGLSCDPPGYPTAKYIQDHAIAYSNPNFTTWGQAGFSKVRNELYDGGC